MIKDEFGDRMKDYESRYTTARVYPNEYLCVRIDGKTFSSYTKGFKKPFDPILTDAMKETMLFLVKETHANLGYTQSDEITLIYSPGEKAKEHIFGGKLSKLNSILASMATAKFNDCMVKSNSVQDKFAYFDCRSWGVPTAIEASNVILWRVQDARKNSVSSLFRWTADAKAMNGLNQIQMKEYLLEHHGVDWNDLSDEWKYGNYASNVSYPVILDDDTLQKIPEDKRPPGNLVIRRKVCLKNYGYFGDMPLEERVAAVER